MMAAIAEILIENERSDTRFEEFAREICERNESITLLPTSKSWDRGRDARSTSPSRYTHQGILCASLNKDIDSKAEADLLRVTSTSSTERLIYCSSQKLSEEKADDLTKIIRRHIPSGSVLVLGAQQLGALADKWPEVFEKYYHAEIRTIRAHLLEKSTAHEKNATLGLRLALVTFGSDDAAVLRQEIMRRAILEFLLDGGGVSPQEISRTMARDLSLSRPLSPERILIILEQEEREGWVRNEGGKWQLTDHGKEQFKAVTSGAAEYLLRGRQIIRENLEELLGRKFAELQYEQIWSALLDFLSNLFYSNGLTIIHAINEFLGESKKDSAEASNLRNLLQDGARRIGRIAGTPDTRKTLEQAIIDTFTERAGAAFEWLTKICERFVVLCSLGLESASAEQIRNVIRNHQLVPDTGVILSYLCDGEPDHQAARELLTRWLQSGGRILLSPVVLEEVAYHAWISQRDFQETELLLGKLTPREALRYTHNAFVRAYHILEKTAKRWPLYIGQFRGTSPTDYSKILKVLQFTLGADKLPDTYDDKLRRDITAYLLDSAAAEEGVEPNQLNADFVHKINRDGRLLASLAAARSAQFRAGSDNPIMILSLSRRLRQGDSKFRTQIGDPRATISISAVSYLLSMVPEVSLGAGSLRRALFEFGEKAHLTDTERRALRIIRATDLYDVPWANRNLLEELLKAAIHAEASKLGVDPDQLRAEFVAGADSEHSAKLVAEALKSMAIQSTDREKLQDAENRIRQLETRLIELQER